MSKPETSNRAPRRPSLCRDVLYRTSHGDEQWNGSSEHAAKITGVVSGDVVNLIVFPNGGMPVPRLNVSRQGTGKTPKGFPSCSWAWPVVS